MNTTTVPQGLALETVFKTLSDRRRRYALYALHRAEGNSMTIPQLARRIEELDGGGSTTGRDRDRTDIVDDLRSRHVPALVAIDVVECDDRSETVRYHTVPSLEEWLEHAEYKEDKHPYR